MKYLIGFLVIVALGLAGFLVTQKETTINSENAEVSTVAPTGVEHAIVLTEEGFEPSEIKITPGDTIVFSATSSYENLYWPASNIHPTHSLYSEFDPLKPIEPDATWSFTFAKKGEWRFHDHLRPYQTGVITVE